MSKETNIWCENHNEFSELMKILHSKGYRWACGNSALEWNPYSQTYHDDDAGIEIEITPRNSKIRYGFRNSDNNISFTDFKIKEGFKVDNFTKADLKDGMVVCSRQGKYYMYFEKFGKFVRNTAHMDLSSYDNNLKYAGEVLNDNRLDIMQVYEVTNLNCLDLANQSHNFNLLWSRPEEVEMTISEIEEKLGIKNLKVVAEKEQ